MSPIKGLSEVHRLPRLGKIHLGIKKKSKRSGVEYPSATDYFVCPPEVQKVYGEKPKRLDVIIPLEDTEIWASQYYRQYSRSRGLVCKGDGITCRRMVDTTSGDVANRDTKTVTWKEGMECKGHECPDYQRKVCQEVMNLQVLLPKVPGLGVWQIDTGSINSIRNINDCATMIRAVCEHVSWIPLALTLEPTEVVNPDDGKKKTVYCLHLHHEKGLSELLDVANKPRATLLIAPPVDTEEPRDEGVKNHSAEAREELGAQVEEDIENLFGSAEPSQTSPGEQGEQGKGQQVETDKLPPSTVSLKGKETEPPPDVGIDMDWLSGAMKKIHWNENTVKTWLKIKSTEPLATVLTGLSQEQKKLFTDHIRELEEVA